jgi:hypothetical protein
VRSNPARVKGCSFFKCLHFSCTYPNLLSFPWCPLQEGFSSKTVNLSGLGTGKTSCRVNNPRNYCLFPDFEEGIMNLEKNTWECRYDEVYFHYCIV